MSLATLRDTFTDAFSAIGAVVYDYTPPVVSTPAVFVFPGDPYMAPETIGLGRLKVTLQLTAAVAHNDNQASLGNLEDLLLGIFNAMPQGVRIIRGASAPSMTQVGPSNLLVSELTVELVTTTGD